ncbi:MAG: ABC transporter permease, partial [Cycloclasticus sp.]|nr:ABC transporter permease [Cycloclasticus sp.]
MLSYLQRLGAVSISMFERLGRGSLFFGNIVFSVPSVI